MFRYILLHIHVCISFHFQEVKDLKDQNTRLSAQLLQHGKQLVAQKPQSLAEELEDAPRNEVSFFLIILEDLEPFYDHREPQVNDLKNSAFNVGCTCSNFF